MQVACISCYCHGLGKAEEAGSLEYDFYQSATAKDKCSSFAEFDTLGTSISVGVAVALAFVNAAMGVVISKLVHFERQRSRTASHRSQCVKMLCAQYLNTSITPLIASAEIRWLSVVFGGVIFKYGYPDFTTNWCAAAS
jgi:hypothetical protein